MVRFNDLAEKHGFDLEEYREDRLNDQIYNTSVEIRSDLDFIEEERLNRVKNKDLIDINVNYAVWRNPLYLKYLYLSILSQITYTDVLNVERLSIQVGENLYPLAKELFSFLGTHHSFRCSEYPSNHTKWTSFRTNVQYTIGLDNIRFTKSPISKHYSISASINSSVVFYSESMGGFYQSIESAYERNENFPILTFRVKSKKRFNEELRKNCIFYDEEEYIKFVNKRLSIKEHKLKRLFQKSDCWFDTSMFIFETEKFDSEDQQWRDFLSWCEIFSLDSNDLIFIPYAYKKGYNIRSISNINGVSQSDSLNGDIGMNIIDLNRRNNVDFNEFVRKLYSDLDERING